MPFSISGRIAEGMDDALAQVLDRRLKEATRQQVERQNAAENLMRQQGLELQKQGLEQSAANQGLAQKRFDLEDLRYRDKQTEEATNRNRASDMAGVLTMGGGPDMPGGGMKPEDQIREISGLALKSGADPLKVIANLQPAKPNQQSYTYTDPKTQQQELRFFDKNQPQTGLDLGKHVPQREPQEPGIQLTPAGLDVAALTYFKTGQMPTLGMGDRGNRQAIINRAATLTPADRTRIEGMADIASNKQDFAANTKSLGALQQQRDSIGAFEQTALKNIDVFLDQAGKVVDTGSPLANTLAREFSGTVLGDKNVAAYKAARQVAINEIAKITSNPTLAGQLSDTARQEVAEFNPKNATVAQTVNVMRLLKTEMGNRVSSLDNQIGEIKKRGKTAPPAGGVTDDIDAEIEAIRAARAAKKPGD
jgi:hypothetical protein